MPLLFEKVLLVKMGFVFGGKLYISNYILYFHFLLLGVFVESPYVLCGGFGGGGDEVLKTTMYNEIEI